MNQQQQIQQQNTDKSKKSEQQIQQFQNTFLSFLCNLGFFPIDIYYQLQKSDIQSTKDEIFQVATFLQNIQPSQCFDISYKLHQTWESLYQTASQKSANQFNLEDLQKLKQFNTNVINSNNQNENENENDVAVKNDDNNIVDDELNYSNLENDQFCYPLPANLLEEFKNITQLNEQMNQSNRDQLHQQSNDNYFEDGKKMRRNQFQFIKQQQDQNYLSIYEKLYHDHLNKTETNIFLENAKSSNETASCTFNPTINKNSSYNKNIKESALDRLTKIKQKKNVSTTEEQQVQSCTFTPQINRSSSLTSFRISQSLNKENLKNKQQTQQSQQQQQAAKFNNINNNNHNTSSSNHINNKSSKAVNQNNLNSHYDQLYYCAEIQRQSLKQKKNYYQNKEMAQCSFKPTINTQSQKFFQQQKSNTKKKNNEIQQQLQQMQEGMQNQNQNLNQQEYIDQQNMMGCMQQDMSNQNNQNQAAYDRLYSNFQQNQQKKIQKQIDKKNSELEGYTFQPQSFTKNYYFNRMNKQAQILQIQEHPSQQEENNQQKQQQMQQQLQTNQVNSNNINNEQQYLNVNPEPQNQQNIFDIVQEDQQNQNQNKQLKQALNNVNQEKRNSFQPSEKQNKAQQQIQQILKQVDQNFQQIQQQQQLQNQVQDNQIQMKNQSQSRSQRSSFNNQNQKNQQLQQNAKYIQIKQEEVRDQFQKLVSTQTAYSSAVKQHPSNEEQEKQLFFDNENYSNNKKNHNNKQYLMFSDTKHQQQQPLKNVQQEKIKTPIFDRLYNKLHTKDQKIEELQKSIDKSMGFTFQPKINSQKKTNYLRKKYHSQSLRDKNMQNQYNSVSSSQMMMAQNQNAFNNHNNKKLLDNSQQSSSIINNNNNIKNSQQKRAKQQKILSQSQQQQQEFQIEQQPDQLNLLANHNQNSLNINNTNSNSIQQYCQFTFQNNQMKQEAYLMNQELKQ